MTDNLRIWSEVEKTDPNHTKKVTQRGGFTAISAAYQIKRATETFGPIGEGWGYEAGEPIFHDALVFVPVTLWHSGDRNMRFGPMTGGAEWKGSNGRVDSDAIKKATTDALTKLLSQLGFNADVFLGLFDDNKYVETMRAEFAGAPANGPDVAGGGPDWWGCTAPGMSASAAKKEGLGDKFDEWRIELATLTSATDWRQWCKDHNEEIGKLPKSWRVILREEAEAIATELGVDFNRRAA